MAKYKARESYSKAKVNYFMLGSPAKHEALLRGEVIEITNPDKDIKKHLEILKEKK